MRIQKTIAYITSADPNDKHAWSGTDHYIWKALISKFDKVVAFGPAEPKVIGFFCKAFNQISLRVFKKRFDYRHSTIYAKAFGRLFTQRLKQANYDFVVVSGGTEYCAYIQTDLPIYIVVDRTIAGALNYHSILKDLWAFSKQQSIATDRLAMHKATKVFFSSEWAADHARQLYQLDPSKLVVLPFGANLDLIPTPEEAFVPKSKTTWHLLFIGTSWDNKGANIALNTLDILLAQNIKATLTIVGCQPPSPISKPQLDIIPFVDKNSEQGIKIMWNLFQTHHFFILPTRFDCTPIVFCEASAFAVPVICSDTGGVRGHVQSGENGFLIPFEDQGELFAAKIISIINHANAYENLCLSTRAQFDQRLNWTSWVESFSNQINL